MSSHSLPKFQGPFTPTSERYENARAVQAGIFWVPLWFFLCSGREGVWLSICPVCIVNTAVCTSVPALTSCCTGEISCTLATRSVSTVE